MGRIRTHYDNLKVSRDAPQEVIQAAYETLAGEYRQQSDPNGERILSLLTAAHAVLSFPEKRKAHDEWISRAESRPAVHVTDNVDLEAAAPAQGQTPERIGGADSASVQIQRHLAPIGACIWRAR